MGRRFIVYRRVCHTTVLVALLFLTSLLRVRAASGADRRPGIDRAGMDRQVAAGDDFFLYANGRWLTNAAIPPDRDSWGVFQQMAEDVDAQVHAQLTESAVTQAPGGSDRRKAADFFATFMDEEAIERRGFAPLHAEFERIAAISNRVALARVLGEDLRADVDPLNNTDFQTTHLFGLWVSPDFNHAGRNAAYLLQGGLGMPDREYYVTDTPRMAHLREQYQAYVSAMLKLAGWDDAPARAARIFELEIAIARVHATRQESEDARRANNPWPQSEFPDRAPGLDWPQFFKAAGLDHVKTIIVWHPAPVRDLAALVQSQPLESWCDWLRFHAIDRAAPFLTCAAVAEHFAFQNRTLNGTPELAVRWKRGVHAVNAALSDAVGRIYVERYFPASSKRQLQAMTAQLVAAFSNRIDTLTWMAPATKARAREKLATLRVGVGYPDHWVDYTGLEIVPGDAVGDAERAEQFRYGQQRAKIGQPVDVDEWWMEPQTVNAVNLPLQNALNFPAAILQPPFFDPAASAAINYGAVGAIIGHEISHSFDDQGAQFDARGALVDWWTAEDRAHFEASGRNLVTQYDAYAPFPDAHVNGGLTLSENIADLAGLAVAYDAWQAALHGQPAPIIDGLTGPQQFFLSFAQSWRSKIRDEALRRHLITDGHAPARYRADTVRNLDAWYAPFAVGRDLKLFLAPVDRVRVW
jgi:predicted metalloendopeptidase